MPAGRPTKYKPEYNEQARKLCLLGATDEELADFFEVHVDSIYEWKKTHPEFADALKLGKRIADANVAEKLYKRATGYSHEAVKIFADPKTGAEMVVPYTEHYPPDTTACIFWLKNRDKERWRDKHETEVSGKDGNSLVVEITRFGESK